MIKFNSITDTQYGVKTLLQNKCFFLTAYNLLMNTTEQMYLFLCWEWKKIIFTLGSMLKKTLTPLNSK